MTVNIRVLSVVGARPNFMKLAPLDRELARRGGFAHTIVHTGQHYDRNMSDSFFDDLGIPEPHHNLEVGSASHAQQTGEIMKRFEPVLLRVKPDVVLVYGDVNSTVAAALVASKLGVKVGHVEAGLRSRDWTMPEEINRVATDRLSDLLFTPSRDADENLIAEGAPVERIHLIGNIMIDSLVYALPRAIEVDAPTNHCLTTGEYLVVTLHRPSNVDEAATLEEILGALATVALERPVVFPVHPRTRGRMAAFGLLEGATGTLTLIDPVGYVEMLSLVRSAALVVTDSGGLQEEASYLGVPCVTVRPNTERPITCTHWTNRLVASRKESILRGVANAAPSRDSNKVGIEFWDGNTAVRIADALG
jgi:UDP-N-acetylglucosamine 2-epimerase (non-hydrolysing)